MAHRREDGTARGGLLDRRAAEAVATAMQALATPSRVLILDRLRCGACAVGELAEAVDMEQSAVSQQLRVLRHLKLVISQRNGRQVYYGLYDSHVAELLDQAASHVEHLDLSAPEPLEIPQAATR